MQSFSVKVGVSSTHSNTLGLNSLFFSGRKRKSFSQYIHVIVLRKYEAFFSASDHASAPVSGSNKNATLLTL
jgi:hypothetical protein